MTTIIIAPYQRHTSVLKEHPLTSIKLYTIDQIRAFVLGSPNALALPYLMERNSLSVANATEVLHQLCYIDLDTHYDRKLTDLQIIKQDLIKRGYYETDELFISYAKNKPVVIYGYDQLNQFDQRLLQIVWNNKITKHSSEVSQIKDPLPVYSFLSIEEEVVWVASQIVDHLNKGIPMNQIKLIHVADEYVSIINRIFSHFGLSYQLKSGPSLIAYDKSNYFLQLYQEHQDLRVSLELIQEHSPVDQIYNQIIEIGNDYIDQRIRSGLLFDILSYRISTTQLKVVSPNSIKEVEIEQVESEDYVFFLGFHQDQVPYVYTDDPYFNLIELEQLGLDSVQEKNQKEKQRVVDFLNRHVKTFISYCTEGANHPSSLLEELPIKKVEPLYDYSNQYYNQYCLTKAMDQYTQYQQKAHDFDLLYQSQKDISYQTYDNQFKPFPNTKLKQYLKNGLTLSYSSMDSFFKCPFRYYVDYLLRANSKTETPSTLLGQAVHDILCKKEQNPHQDLDQLITSTLDPICFFDSPFKNQFYKQKYHKELLKLIAILDCQNERTNFHATGLEQCVKITLDSNFHINLIGYIDKVLTFEDSENTYVIVIDYKTGHIDTSLNATIYGLNMQLLVYLYLLKQTMTQTNVKVAGMYYQNILNEVEKAKPNQTYASLLWDHYKWRGYTIQNQALIKEIDHNYQEDAMIKGLKIKKDGQFYSSANVLSEASFDSLFSIVEQHLATITKAIHEVDFKINPLRFGKEVEPTGCLYCQNYDICYKKISDFRTVKPYHDLSYLGGELHDS